MRTLRVIQALNIMMNQANVSRLVNVSVRSIYQALILIVQKAIGIVKSHIIGIK